MVLKEMIFNIFFFLWVWWSLKKKIFNSFHFGQVWWSWKNLFLTVSIFGRCGGPEGNDF